MLAWRRWSVPRGTCQWPNGFMYSSFCDLDVFAGKTCSGNAISKEVMLMKMSMCKEIVCTTWLYKLMGRINLFLVRSTVPLDWCKLKCRVMSMASFFKAKPWLFMTFQIRIGHNSPQVSDISDQYHLPNKDRPQNYTDTKKRPEFPSGELFFVNLRKISLKKTQMIWRARNSQLLSVLTCRESSFP